MTDDTNTSSTEHKGAVIRLAFTKGDLPDELVKADQVVQNAFEAEDEFAGLYYDGANNNQILEPPYFLRTLERLSQENNALSPCIEAMVTNIDGTGYTFYKDQSRSTTQVEEDDDPNVQELWDFFGEPWPGESLVTIRKKLRRDIERLGVGYLEVMRNARDEIIFIRHVEGKMMRLVRLDEPVVVTKAVKRRGADIEVKVNVRERRFAQCMANRSVVYFKEFGATRDLDKTTGKWAAQGQRFSLQKRATEILYFTALPDAHTPYGVPRWINQLPSVLGSRKAEEFNLEFFDNGGVPPVLLLLHGGTLASETRKALEQKTGGLASKKNRVQVVEVEPTGGDLNSVNTAKVTVERFGSERQSDSMFEKYDDKCETRVRRAFRLPPIFVGQAADYSFATAYASYTVAEAQVFKPERDEFDEVMSIKVLPALGYAGYRMRSMPLNIQEAALKLEGITLAQATNHVEPGDLITAINETIGSNFKVTAEPVVITPPPTTQTTAQTGAKPAATGANGGSKPTSTTAKKKPKEKTVDRANPTEARKTDVQEDVSEDIEDVSATG